MEGEDTNFPVYKSNENNKIPENMLYNRTGQILSAKANFYVRQLQLKALQRSTHKQPLRGVFLNPADHLDQNNMPILDWPVFIDNDGNAIALYQKNPLGKGNFGETFLGINLDTQEVVAVKVQKTKDLNTKNSIVIENHTLQESGRLLANLEKAKDGLYENYAAQILVWGEPLHHVCEEQGKKRDIDTETFLDMAISLCDNVNAFNLSHIHRDIKPDNIVWDPITRQAHLVDLGLAVPNNNTRHCLKCFRAFAPPEISTKLKQHTEKKKNNTQTKEDGTFEYGPSQDAYQLGLSLAYIRGRFTFKDLSTGNASIPLNATLNSSQIKSDTDWLMASTLKGLIHSNPAKRLSTEQAKMQFSLVKQELLRQAKDPSSDINPKFLECLDVLKKQDRIDNPPRAQVTKPSDNPPKAQVTKPPINITDDGYETPVTVQLQSDAKDSHELVQNDGYVDYSLDDKENHDKDSSELVQNDSYDTYFVEHKENRENMSQKTMPDTPPSRNKPLVETASTPRLYFTADERYPLTDLTEIPSLPFVQPPQWNNIVQQALADIEKFSPHLSRKVYSLDDKRVRLARQIAAAKMRTILDQCASEDQPLVTSSGVERLTHFALQHEHCEDRAIRKVVTDICKTFNHHLGNKHTLQIKAGK